MICQYCNTEISNNANFCEKCGNKLDLSPKCSECGAPHSFGAKSCSECGRIICSENDVNFFPRCETTKIDSDFIFPLRKEKNPLKRIIGSLRNIFHK